MLRNLFAHDLHSWNWKSNTEKGMKLNEFYYDTFLQLDKSVEAIIKDFSDYWQKVRK